MALAYSYRRVSSGGKAQGDKSGLQRQEQALKDWMRRHPDFRLAEELLDPGVSAYTGRNRTQGALGRFLAAARSGSIPKGSVLVVEDHELNRKILCRMLETLGLAPGVACNGREAVAAVSEGRFDLVLMDCRMPVMDGLEAARAIRAAEADGSSRVRIVALTGNTSAEDLDACRRAGMDGMVPKPVALEDLRALLAEISARERA